MFQSHIVRWETDSRWHEACIICDLLGDWTVLRRWGSRFSSHGNFMVEPVFGYLEACRRMEETMPSGGIGRCPTDAWARMWGCFKPRVLTPKQPGQVAHRFCG